MSQTETAATPEAAVQPAEVQEETRGQLMERIDAMNARAYELRNSSDEAESLAEEALLFAESEKYQKGIAEALLTLGWRNFRKGNYDIVLWQSERALLIAEDLGEKILLARVLNTIGLVYHDIREYNKALEYNKRSLAIQEEIGDKQGIAISLGNIGAGYESTGDYSTALEYHTRSLAIKEETGDERGIANSFNGIGNVYSGKGEFGKALEYQLASLSIYEKIGDKCGMATALSNIGYGYVCQDDYSKALEYNERSFVIDEEIGDKYGMALSLNNFGMVYFEMGKYDTALEYQMRALAINEEIGDQRGIAESLGNIGLTYAVKGYIWHNTKKSIEYLTNSLYLSKEIGAKDDVFEAHKALSKVYEQTGNHALALEHYKKYHEIEREVHSEEVAKKTANLEQKRQMDLVQKEQEVTERILSNILPKSIAERMKRGETRIAERFDDVTVLFSDIVGFTNLSSHTSPEGLVQLLDDIFSEFDSIAEKHGLEKIKTIGDAYMVVSGVPEKREDHAEAMMLMALDMQAAMTKFQASMSEDLAIRIGIHTGSVVAGVIGKKKFAYDMWGDAVNVASRMESHGKPNTIHVTEAIVKKLESKATFKKRGKINIKGKGKMTTYFLMGEIFPKKACIKKVAL